MTLATYGITMGSLLLCVLLFDVQLRHLLFNVPFMARKIDTTTDQTADPSSPIDVLFDQLSHTNTQSNPGAAAGVHGAIARLLDAEGQSGAALRHYETAADHAKIAAAVAPPALKLEGILWAGKEREEAFDARMQLVEAYLAHGNIVQAKQQADEQLDDLVGLGSSYIASAYRMAARIRCKVGNPKSALRLLKFARRRLEMTSDPEGPDELIRVMLGIVQAHLQLGDISEAKQVAHQTQIKLCGPSVSTAQCGTTCPGDKIELQAELRQRLGDVALASKSTREATSCYKEAMQLEAQIHPIRHHQLTKLKTKMESVQTIKEPPAKSQKPKFRVQEEDLVSI